MMNELPIGSTLHFLRTAHAAWTAEYTCFDTPYKADSHGHSFEAVVLAIEHAALRAIREHAKKNHPTFDDLQPNSLIGHEHE